MRTRGRGQAACNHRGQIQLIQLLYTQYPDIDSADQILDNNSCEEDPEI